MATRGKSRAGRAGLILLGCVLGLVLCEVVVRVLGIEPRVNVLFRENFRLSDNPVLKYELQPGSPDGEFRISSDGLRDRDVPREKPAGTFRIGIIGDSIAYGLRCAQDEAFARQLQGLLTSAGPDATRYEVLNFGVSGYNIRQVVERLRTLGMEFELDLVIYVYSLNDPQSFSLELEGLRAVQKESERQSRQRGALRRVLSRSRLFLLVWQATQQTTWTRDVRIGRRSPDHEAILAGRPVEYFEALHSGQGWELVREEMTGLALLAGDVTTAPRILVAAFPVFLGPQAYPLSQTHDKVLAEAGRHGLDTLDLAPVFSVERYRDVEAFFIDPFHPTPLGHRVAAYSLLAWMRDAGILDRPRYDAILSANPGDRGIQQR